MRKMQLLALLCAACAVMAGCASKHIVRAAPPSVSDLPPEDTSPMPAPATPPPVSATEEEPAPEVPSPEPPPAPGKRPAAPRRPAPTETADQLRPSPRRRRFLRSSLPKTWNRPGKAQPRISQPRNRICSWPTESNSARRKRI